MIVSIGIGVRVNDRIGRGSGNCEQGLAHRVGENPGGGGRNLIAIRVYESADADSL
jgi:hypothetical protein